MAKKTSLVDNGLQLRSLRLERRLAPLEHFPFNVPVIRSLDILEFTTPVTIFAGENGSGKSTLLEALARAAQLITVGSENAEHDRSLDALKPLSDALRLTWSKRTRRGFFMRSEDFFGYARRMGQLREELQRDLEETDRAYKDRSETAQAYARMSYAGQLGALRSDYGEGLDAQSHGESYLKLFQARFVPAGLYVLDEPEAPLSPLRQLSFMVLLKEMVGQQGQFIIATHSPILMAYPGARLLSFDGEAMAEVAYDDLEHVRITRTFLENPEQYLRYLFNE